MTRMQDSPKVRFSSLRVLTFLVTGLVALYILFTIAIIGLSSWELSYLGTPIASEVIGLEDGYFYVASEELLRVMEIHRLVAIFIIPVFLVGGIASLFWIAKASRNLYAIAPASEAERNFSPTASVLWWFCPIANLWMPYRIMKELLRRSSIGGEVWVVTPIWWILILWTSFLDRIFLRAALSQVEFVSREDYKDYLVGWSYSDMFVSIFEILLAIAFMLLIRRIYKYQEERNCLREPEEVSENV